eukprot:CAMPEP_0185905302 /NCGR_PEP_ID=MMETSP0196C-20130402/4520_1 /TAXON_ID=2932 /ORGANISM="Alexandrium fundyense, Strain CCMP1719" /LENGTH=52 /DNA_ID=CAMNT_0028624797 /DNA_START=40 /DNA_END=195 /DNA_ORIENTATION=-
MAATFLILTSFPPPAVKRELTGLGCTAWKSMPLAFASTARLAASSETPAFVQ